MLINYSIHYCISSYPKTHLKMLIAKLITKIIMMSNKNYKRKCKTINKYLMNFFSKKIKVYVDNISSVEKSLHNVKEVHIQA